MENIKTETDLAIDVLAGLSAPDKYLLSKYFYDDNGSKIFQDIMQMPEYYLTDCELEIFTHNKQEIYQEFTKGNNHFGLIELGAGDGVKTKVLLSHFLKQSCDFEYVPIDISEESVKNLVMELKKELPTLRIDSKVGDYFQMMEDINLYDSTRKILLFLGSNIGNYNRQETLLFLSHLKAVMKSGDLLFIGFDLKKDPDTILKAYNDPYGYTSAFNLNLLQRINRELDASFDLSAFKHQEHYDPKTGTARSELVSLKKQQVEINSLNLTASFEKGEPIFMELSQKYDETSISELAQKSGFQIVRNFFDQRLYYTNSLWKI